jgi:filamentous hemagglutinin family protein
MRSSLYFLTTLSKVILGLILLPDALLAQVAPDQTLGAERSQVAPNQMIRGLPSDRIDGGAQRGGNLFHSFSEFNVGAGRGVYFSNPASVQTILTRVTGSNPSNILGRLGVLGDANLFLLNPNGIVFGANASLDVTGSFYASTASAIQLGTDGSFSATAPQTSSLLAVQPNALFLNALASQRGDITNAGNLAVGAGQTLSLFGGTVVSSGRLSTPGGTVQVLGDRVGLIDQAQIDVSSPTGGGTVLIGGAFRGEGTVPTARLTHVGSDVVIKANATNEGNGGTVVVWAQEATGFYGQVQAQGGLRGGNGGLVEVSGLQRLTFQGMVDTSAPLGLTGNLLLDPTNIFVVAGATPNPPNAADGIWSALEDPGDQLIGADAIVTLLNSTSVTLEATNGIFVGADVQANSPNNLTLTAPIVEIFDAIVTQDGGGDIRVNAPNYLYVGASAGGFAALGANTYSTVDAGDLVINAGEVFFDGDVIVSSNVENGGFARGGTVSITSNGLYMTNGAQIQAILRGDILGPPGDGIIGTIRINTNLVYLDGVSPTTGADSRIASDIGSGSFSFRLPGESLDTVDITTQALFMFNGSTISTTVYERGFGDASNIKIDAGQVFVDGSTIRSNIDPDAFGNSGQVRITASDFIVLQNSADVFTTTSGEGNAGNIVFDVPTGSILLDGASRVRSNVDIGGFGNAGNIQVTSGTLVVQNNSEIISNTSGIGDAGTVTIAASSSVTLENRSFIRSDVTSDGQGNAGGINLTAQSLALLDGGQLDSSTRGFGNAGDVTVTTTGDIVFRGLGLDGGNGVPSSIFSLVDANAVGQAGDISVTTTNGSLRLSEGSEILSVTFGEGDAGNITVRAPQGDVLLTGVRSTSGNETTISSDVANNGFGRGGIVDIQARSLSLLDGASIKVSNNGIIGTGGSVLVDADRVELAGSGTNAAETVERLSGIYASTDASSIGDGGTITIVNADAVTVRDRAVIDTRTQNAGAGGQITLDNIGTLTVATEGQINAQTTYAGLGGSIAIGASTVAVNSGGQILTTASGAGTAGSITVNASQVALDGTDSGLFVNATQTASGDGGDLSVTTGSFTATNEAQLSASTGGLGDAGTITVNATGDINLDSNAQIRGTVEEAATGDGSVITLSARNLSMAGGAQVVANTTGQGKAGDIQVRVSDRVSLSGANTGFFATTRDYSADPAGITIAEAGDAGRSLDTAQDAAIAPPGRFISEITGTIVDTDVDIYKITLDGNQTFSATTSGDTDFDTQLFLFDGSGRGIYADDESGGATQATLPANNSLTPITAGTYYLAISAWDNDPVSTAGPIFADGFYLVDASGPGGSAPLTGWTDNNITSGGFYTITLTGLAGAPQQVLPGGAGGNITVQGQSLSITNQAQLAATTAGQGNAGSVSINVSNLEVANAQVVTSTSGAGQGGTLTVNASNSAVLTNGSQLLAQTSSTGNAGGLTLSVRNLTLSTGAEVSTSTSGSGNAGRIALNVANLDINNAQVVASTSGAGQGGTLAVNASGSVNLTNDAKLLAQATSSGNAGALTLVADRIRLATGAEISTSTSGAGDAGNLGIRADRLTLQQGSKITSLSTGTGNAGVIDLQLGILSANAGEISASAEQAGGGQIGITARAIFLRNSSPILSSVFDGNGGGGSISITSNLFIALEDSDILANARFGDGGRITINSPVFLADLFARVGQNPGAEFSRFRGNGRVDISASSEFGVSGVVSIPDFSFLQNSLSSLASNFVSPDQIVAGSCISRRNTQSGSFVVTGQGGLARTPYDARINSPYELLEVEPIPAPTQEKPRSNTPTPAIGWQPGQPIQEAEGLVKLADGRIMLATGLPSSKLPQPDPCHDASPAPQY